MDGRSFASLVRRDVKYGRQDTRRGVGANSCIKVTGNSSWSGEGSGPDSSSLYCCCRVTERWWLVAGLRRVGIRWFDDGLEDAFPLGPRIEVERLTSLLGSNWDGLLPLCKMGPVDPWENNEGESGPMLDRGLPFCELGITDSLRIQDPFDEIESRRSSVPCSGVDVLSPSLLSDPIRLVLFMGESFAVNVLLMYRWLGYDDGWMGEEVDNWPRRGVFMTELVAGRTGGEE